MGTRLWCVGATLCSATGDCLRNSETSERSSAPLGLLQGDWSCHFCGARRGQGSWNNVSSELSAYLLCHASRQADHQRRCRQNTRPGRRKAAHFCRVNCSFPVRRTANRVPLVRFPSHSPEASGARFHRSWQEQEQEQEHWWWYQTSARRCMSLHVPEGNTYTCDSHFEISLCCKRKGRGGGKVPTARADSLPLN